MIPHYRPYCSESRPHSALRYLPPCAFYRSDAAAALAAAARQAHWQAHRQP
jgi:hypothetical protein